MALDRRQFISWTTGVAGTGVPGLALAQGGSAPPSDGPPTRVDVTGLLMQDFESGLPFQSPAAGFGPVAASQWATFGTIVPYAAGDGSLHLLDVPNAMTVWHAQVDANSVTGWGVAQSANSLMSPGWRDIAIPVPLVVPGGDQDRLVVWRDKTIASTGFDAAGSLLNGRVRMLTMPDNQLAGRPVCSGPLAGPTRWLPEMIRDLGGLPTAIVMRDLQGLDAWPALNTVRAVAPGIFPIDDAWGRRQLFTIASPNPDAWRGVLCDGGQVTFFTLAPRPGDLVFDVIERVPLGEAPLGTIAVAESGSRSFEIIIPGLQAITTWRGRFEEQGTGKVSWGATDKLGLPELHSPTFPAGTTYHAVVAYDAQAQGLGLFLNVRPAAAGSISELWATARVWKADSSSEQWQPLAPIDEGCQVLSALRGDSTRLFARRDANGAFEFWQRTPDGDWSQDPVIIPAETGNGAGHVAETVGCRVGITLLRDNAPLPGASLRITSAVPTIAQINGARVTLRRQRAAVATADANGTVWITTTLQGRLSFPLLYVACDRFERNLELDMNGELDGLMANLQTDDLAQARDPRGAGQAVLPNSGDAEAAAEAIRSMMSIRRAGAVPGTSSIQLTALHVTAIWVGPNITAAAVRNHVVANPEVRWRLETLPGQRAVFEPLTAAQAEAHVTRMAATGVRPQFGIFDAFSDALDWIGDIASAAWRGLCKVKDMVIDGARLALTLTIKGIDYIFQGVLDTIERVMDAVSFVLDAVGAALGTAIGWVLAKLGFIFDWEALKARRDEFKQVIQTGAAGMTTAVPDPTTLVAPAIAKLDQLEAQLRALRSTPVASTRLGSRLSASSTLEAITSSGSSTIMPQASWLLEKVQQGLSRVAKNPDAPQLPGLVDALAALGGRANAISTSLTAALDELAGVATSWATGGNDYASSALQGVIDAMLTGIAGLVAALKEVIRGLGDVLKALWNGFVGLVQWLDNRIYIPFFTSFYEALTKGRFSFLDVTCLLAALTDRVVGGASALGRSAAANVRAMAGPASQDKVTAWRCLEVFMVAGCFTTALDTLATASSGGDDPISNILTGLNVATTIAVAACGIVMGGDFIYEIVFPSILAVLGALGVVLYVVDSPKIVKAKEFVAYWMTPIVQVLITIYAVVRMATSGPTRNMIGYWSLAIVQAFISMGIWLRTKRVRGQRTPIHPLLALALGIVQGGLAATRTGLYERPAQAAS
jgi:hypothetical protein